MISNYNVTTLFVEPRATSILHNIALGAITNWMYLGAALSTRCTIYLLPQFTCHHICFFFSTFCFSRSLDDFASSFHSIQAGLTRAPWAARFASICPCTAAALTPLWRNFALDEFCAKRSCFGPPSTIRQEMMSKITKSTIAHTKRSGYLARPTIPTSMRSPIIMHPLHHEHAILYSGLLYNILFSHIDKRYGAL